jgi:outer membrane protein assembly factor BamA
LGKVSYILIYFFVLWPVYGIAQEKIHYHIQASERVKAYLNRNPLPESPADSLFIFKGVNQLQIQLQANGYLLAQYKVASMDDGLYFTINEGEQFHWAGLKKGNLDEGLLSSIGFRERFYDQKPFRPREVARLMARIIQYSEDRGYPFASVKLDSVYIEETFIEAVLKYDKGPFITFDDVEVEGSTKTKASFLTSYLQIKPGHYYSEKKVRQAQRRLSRLPYLETSGPSFVSFANEKGKLHLDLQDRPCSHVDGIIGIMPNEMEDNRVLITGQLNMHLYNLFGTGKNIQLDWQRLRALSQFLNAKYIHPNLLGSPVGASFNFHLLKEDTTFLSRDMNIEFNSPLGGGGNIRAFTNRRITRLLSVAQFKNLDRLPDVADFNLTIYGVGYDWQNLDHLIYPTKGWQISLEGGIGNKVIRRNTGLDERLYDELSDGYLQYNLKTGMVNYSAVRKRMVLVSRINAGLIHSDVLFLNDLQRVGGLNSLRGFNENNFFASHYAIGSTELRFMMDNNRSYLMLFYDQSYLKFNLSNRKFEDYPLGLGAGISLTTETGVFNFVYALGRSLDQPLNLNLSKIHFGYVNRF